MARAISLAGRDVFAGATHHMAQRLGAHASLGHVVDPRHILLDRNLHAALGLANLALAVAFTMAVDDSIGALAGAGLCISAAAVAFMLMLRAAEVPQIQARRPARAAAAPRPEPNIRGLSRSGVLGIENTRREVSGLLAMMNHELRTPLNAVLGNAEAIRHEILGPVGTAGYRDSARHILDGGQNLLRASENMLTLTSALAAAALAPQQPVDLESTLREVLRDAMPEATAKDVALSWQSEAAYSVLTEPAGLHHALASIVAGALSNADAGAGIHVELTPSAGTVELMLTLSHGDAAAARRTTGIVDCGGEFGPAALQISVARTLAALLGTHLHTAHGIDGRWRAILDLPAAPAQA